MQQWRFDIHFVETLPADPARENRRRRVNKNACYSRVQPIEAKKPQLIAVSDEMLRELDLDPAAVERTRMY